jgi:hypothetical protein
MAAGTQRVGKVGKDKGYRRRKTYRRLALGRKEEILALASHGPLADEALVKEDDVVQRVVPIGGVVVRHGVCAVLGFCARTPAPLVHLGEPLVEGHLPVARIVLVLRTQQLHGEVGGLHVVQLLTRAGGE